MRISDWSSDVCSSDLLAAAVQISACRHSRGTVRRPAMTRWYVAQTQAQGEERARLNLERQGFRTYLPRYRRERRHARRRDVEIGRAHVCTPVTNAHLVCRLLLETKKKNMTNQTP